MGKTVKRRENKMAKGKGTKKAAKPVRSKGNVVQFKQKFDSNFEGFIRKIRIDAKTRTKIRITVILFTLVPSL